MTPRTVPSLVTAIAAVVLSLQGGPLWAQGSPQPAPGTAVRVTLSRGSHTGTLVSLTGTEIVFRQKKSVDDTRYPLSVVTRIETVHHNARNLAIAGGAAGLVIALASDLCGSGRPYGAAGATGEPDCITAKPLLITAGMAGLGAVIGGAIDGDKRRVLYPTSSPPPAVRIAPMLVRKGAGLQITLNR